MLSETEKVLDFIGGADADRTRDLPNAICASGLHAKRGRSTASAGRAHGFLEDCSWMEPTFVDALAERCGATWPAIKAARANALALIDRVEKSLPNWTIRKRPSS
jgi:hypothetical protein